MSYFTKISTYINFIKKIMSNNLLNTCNKCFIICFLNLFCICFMMNDIDNKNNKKNSEDSNSYIIEINDL
jgi:hypothetical protein